MLNADYYYKKSVWILFNKVCMSIFQLHIQYTKAKKLSKSIFKLLKWSFMNLVTNDFLISDRDP